MRTISYDEISAVAGAGSPCAGLIAGYAGAIALGVAAGLTDGVALIDGVGIWGAVASLGQAIGDAIC